MVIGNSNSNSKIKIAIVIVIINYDLANRKTTKETNESKSN